MIAAQFKPAEQAAARLFNKKTARQGVASVRAAALSLQTVAGDYRDQQAARLAHNFAVDKWERGTVEAVASLASDARQIARRTDRAGLGMHAGDDAVRSMAELRSKHAAKVGRAIMAQGVRNFGIEEDAGRGEAAALDMAEQLYDEAACMCVRFGVDPAKANGETTLEIMAAVRRMWCAKWWRRRLRAVHGRWMESERIRFGMVSKGRAVYVSDDALADRGEQRERNDDLLKSIVAYCEGSGDAVGLDKCAEASVSNPVNRRHEAMARLRGLDEWAEGQGYAAAFWTLTAPSRFHRMRTVDKGRPVVNRHWQGATPRDTQAYLCRVWSNIRARLNRDGLTAYGFRVAEPHHDATPHWHLLIFAKPEDMPHIEAIARHYALLDSPDERGADVRRFVVEHIDRARGSAVGYVAKYISKALDGMGMEDGHDEAGERMLQAVRRVDAWRSLWGIRQFQFFASGSVTVWRELRRLEERPAGPMGDAWRAAQSATFGGGMDGADWRAFMLALEQHPISILQAASDEPGEYGLPISRVVGLACEGVTYMTRTKVWQLIDRRDALRLGLVSITVSKNTAKPENKGGHAPPEVVNE